MSRIDSRNALVGLGAFSVTAVLLLLQRGVTEAFAQGATTTAPGTTDNSQGRGRLRAACATRNWFNLTPRRINLTCDAPLPAMPITSADVDGDGIIEQFPFTAKGAVVLDSGPVCPGGANGIPPTAAYGVAVSNLLVATEVVAAAGEITISTASVLDLPVSFGDSLKPLLPSPGYPADGSAYRMTVSDLGWFDCDLDGDLDLVLILKTESRFKYDCCNWWCGWFNPTTQAIWLENVNHQRANPFDLDRDGQVNIADISLLLLEFTE